MPRRSKHRVWNSSEENLIIIEVQNGEYCGEDDIERFDDKYGLV
jgi:mannose-6-phosphate isomerase-like protein (cupin superfamily)